ncbi:MAG: hypothetical protein ACTHJ5_06915 [Ilyomonas sp.]
MKQNILNFCLLLAVIFFSLTSSAQKRMIRGYVLDSSTRVPMTNAIITNENTHQLVFTDQNGFFQIIVSRNDMLSFDAFNYKFDTLIVNRILPDTVFITMTREAETLPGVTVSTQGYSKYQMDSLQRRLSFISDVGPKRPSISKANSQSAGLGINLDAIFGKRNKQKKRAYKFFEQNEKRAYVDYRFSSVTVSEYTGLKGDSLVLFMKKYTPSYEWLRAHPSNEDIVYYINDKLKQFMDDKR